MEGHIPYYEKLSVKRVYPQVIKKEEFRTYMPEREEGGKFPERDFFYGVLRTLFPEYLAGIIKKVQHLRNASDSQPKKEMIEPNPESLSLLKSTVFKLSK